MRRRRRRPPTGSAWSRHTVELRLAEAETALQHAEQRAAGERLAAAQASERQGEVEVRLAQELANRKNVERDLADAHLKRDTLQQSLDTSQEQLQRVTSANSEAQENLERASSEHTAERARLVAERDTQLQAQAARHSASQQAAKNAVTQIEDGLRLALEARSRDRREIEQLEGALEARGQELEAARSEREALRTQADRVPQLQHELDDSRAQHRRQFRHTPYGICRCARDGTLEHVNHALVALLGYRTFDELRTVDFATTVFESADDLRLLIERCLSNGTTESVETSWRRKDSGRLVVRLLALQATSESIEIVVEDITNLRALEERLRRAEPMDAVARLASEVAGTCDNLLRDVSQDAQQWLETIDRDSAFRHQGERLLHEVTRAAGFLRQLAVYGAKQAGALEPIDVNRVLRDLEPVLKRIAGDDIELVLPKTSSPVNVDVEAERVERVLVNVASYGRERMPFGGRLTIELATVVVGREFVTKYPNVRPGDHVLITVNETSGGLRSAFPIGPRTEPAAANIMRSVSDNRPGVDLGVLQGLIRDCGGHLWMTAEPTGDMVLKMHLPQRLPDGPDKPLTERPRSNRVRSMARWLRH